MAGYLRELLRDITLVDHEEVEAGSESHIARIDIYNGIEALYAQGVLQDTHILALNNYFIGDSHWQLVPGIQELLSFALKQLEHKVGSEYTDESFIKRCLTKYPKYAKMQQVLVNDLIQMGDTL